MSLCLSVVVPTRIMMGVVQTLGWPSLAWPGLVDDMSLHDMVNN